MWDVCTEAELLNWQPGGRTELNWVTGHMATSSGKELVSEAGVGHTAAECVCLFVEQA